MALVYLRQRLGAALRSGSCPRVPPSRLFSDTVRPGEIGEVSGVPVEHLHRKVVIYSPARVATSQGEAKQGQWKLNFESTQKWENPLMGWTSTADPYANVGDSALVFDSKDAAVEFCSKYGWEFTVKEPKQQLRKPKAYADNFKWKGAPASAE